MNLALPSTKHLVDRPLHVTIDDSKIEELAKQWSDEEFEIPSWNWPPYPELENDELISYHLLIETINFAFTNFYTGAKFETDYKGKPQVGSMGMVAATTRGLEEGFPLLDGRYLRDITRTEMEHIYRSTSPEAHMPMMAERHEIFREVGEVLCDKYGGQFAHVQHRAGGKLFGGAGLVDLLSQNFPSFNDHNIFNRKKLVFNKRAQLAGGILYSRFKADGVELFRDVDELTVFPDYQVPRSLRSLGVITYAQTLADKVDGKVIIPKGTREELEIRAATIHAADRLIKGVNEHRSEPIHALHMDYKLWSEGRKNQTSPHHLTITTAY